MKIIFIYLFIYSFMKPFFNKIKEINDVYNLYPKWLKKKNGDVIPCENDNECPFPSACCNEPFFPVKFCCYGWNKRKLEYAYIVEYVKA